MVRNEIFWIIWEQSYFVYYPIISYLGIKVYKVETINMGRYHWNNGVIGKFLISISTTVCRNLLSTDSRLNRIDPSTNIFLPNPERGYRTKFEILLEEVFPNSIE